MSESAKSAALGTELMDTHKGIEFGTKVFSEISDASLEWANLPRAAVHNC